MNDSVLVEMHEIIKNFGGLRAVDSVDFSVKRGEVVGLLGENGAGKSTLIKILTGIYRPDYGEIRFEGKPVEIRNRADSQRLGIEPLYQDLSLVGTLDAASNVFLGKELTQKSLGFLPTLKLAAMQKEAEKILWEQLGIDFKNRWEPVYNLSGGERQAVALARAIYYEAKLVILDEPMASLGVEEVKRTLDIIRKLRETGISVIVISHNLEHVYSVADRVVVLHRGKKVADSPSAELTPDEVVKLMVFGERAKEVKAYE